MWNIALITKILPQLRLLSNYSVNCSCGLIPTYHNFKLLVMTAINHANW